MEMLHGVRVVYHNPALHPYFTTASLHQRQVLPTRLEDVQEQLRATSVRLAGAEAEGSRIRAEAQRTADTLSRTGCVCVGGGMRVYVQMEVAMCWWETYICL